MITQNSIVMPAVTPQQAIESWEKYQALKEKVKTKDDIQTISDKEFLKKSYWRKIARFFNLSVEVVEERYDRDGDLHIFHFKARATAPNGAFVDGVGSCDSSEKGLAKSIHNTRTIAETRAWNRAVSNLVGGGEVSAEEVGEDEKPTSGIKCNICGADMSASKYKKGEYYCSAYKKGCKNKAMIDKNGEIVYSMVKKENGK